MKNYIEEKVEAIRQTLVSIVCDKCKKEYGADDILEIQEFQLIKFTGGYGSVFGDMLTVEADICQHCLKELIGSFCRCTDDWENEYELE